LKAKSGDGPLPCITFAASRLDEFAGVIIPGCLRWDKTAAIKIY
jgi:hypothetical protein